jgi:hypothetical protein
MDMSEVENINFELQNNLGMSKRERSYLVDVQNSLIDNLILDAMLEEF